MTSAEVILATRYSHRLILAAIPFFKARLAGEPGTLLEYAAKCRRVAQQGSVDAFHCFGGAACTVGIGLVNEQFCALICQAAMAGIRIRDRIEHLANPGRQVCECK